ncbi:MAG TPA: hypothetical protein V6C72_10345, partial [Chroococcales cyanobacterium]
HKPLRRKVIRFRAEITALSAILISAGFALYAGFSFESPNKQNRAQPQAAALLASSALEYDSPLPRGDAGYPGQSGGSQLPQSEYFSSWTKEDPHTRFFHFSSSLSDSLGVIQDSGSNSQVLRIQNGKPVTGNKSASGDVIMQNFQPFGLAASSYLLDEPALLKHFRPDEIKALYIINDVVGNDRALQNIRGWRALTKLNIQSANGFTDGCLPYIDQIPSLTALTLSDTRVTAPAIASMKRLLQFQSLNFQHVKKLAPVFDELAKSKALQQLYLRRTGVEDSDLEKIGRLSNLRVLDISENEGFSSKGFAHLAQLPHLEELYADRSGISDDCIQYLSSMKKLKVLTVSNDKLSSQGRIRAIQALPKGCKVFDNYATNMDVH